MTRSYKDIKPPAKQAGTPKSADTRTADSFRAARKGSALPDPYRPRSYRERQTARKASS